MIVQIGNRLFDTDYIISITEIEHDGDYAFRIDKFKFKIVLDTLSTMNSILDVEERVNYQIDNKEFMTMSKEDQKNHAQNCIKPVKERIIERRKELIDIWLKDQDQVEIPII